MADTGIYHHQFPAVSTSVVQVKILATTVSTLLDLEKNIIEYSAQWVI